MPELKPSSKYEGLKELVQKLGTIDSVDFRLTLGWTVNFSVNTKELPGSVVVCFNYNNKMGVDEKALMFVICEIATVGDLFVEAASIASQNLRDDPKRYKGCYGVGVFRELCTLRDKESGK